MMMKASCLKLFVVVLSLCEGALHSAGAQTMRLVEDGQLATKYHGSSCYGDEPSHRQSDSPAIARFPTERYELLS